MSLPHAILGFLQFMPLSGYDLKTQAFDRSVAHFWPAVQPQIYRELERMDQIGWVTRHTEIQTGRPNRNVYAITEAGRAEFERWLHTFQPPPAHREAFLIQLFFAAQLPNTAIRELLQAQLRAHEQRLATLEQIVIPPADDPQAQRRRTFTGWTRDLGVRLEQTYIAWLRECLERIGEASNEFDG
jgi:PadR family transcriptional regulator, regulatory protein AphA